MRAIIYTGDDVRIVVEDYNKIHAVYGNLPTPAPNLVVFIPFNERTITIALNAARNPASISPFTDLTMWQECVKFLYTYTKSDNPLSRECGRACREMLRGASISYICNCMEGLIFGCGVVLRSVNALWLSDAEFATRIRREFSLDLPKNAGSVRFLRATPGLLRGIEDPPTWMAQAASRPASGEGPW